MNFVKYLTIAVFLQLGILAADAETALSSSASIRGNSTTNAPADQETRELKPRDMLRYNILEDPVGRGVLPQITITDLGDAQFPISATSSEYISVKAAGRRLSEIRRELKMRLDSDYYQNATVSVDLISVEKSQSMLGASQGKVIFFGAFNYVLSLREDQKMTLSEAFALVSGQATYANLKNVEIFRLDPATKQSVLIKRDVRKLLDNDLREDMELKDGDRIKTREKLINGL